MRVVELQSVENRLDVVAGAFLRIAVDAFRNIRWGKPAGVIGNAAVATPEIAKLMLPGAAVAGKFVNEDDRSAGADLLVIELHAVVGGEMRHSWSPETSLSNRLRVKRYRIGLFQASRMSSRTPLLGEPIRDPGIPASEKARNRESWVPGLAPSGARPG